MGRLTSDDFDYISDRVRSKVTGWDRLMSYAGKEVMIKAVLQAMPTYSMSCFQLSKGSCQKITSLIARFWWGGSLDKKAMHWLSWDKLARPKSSGGLGFRDLELFNLALLGKQGWRLLTQPQSLCAQVLRSRYYPNGDFMTVNPPSTASKTWRAILAGRQALNTGLIKRVGTGSTVSIWQDKWIPGMNARQPMGRLIETDKEWVLELIDPDLYKWRTELVRSIFVALKLASQI
jgi:hypothetical protein